ncbi:DUF2393 family protein [Sulfurospirillum arcachonense]|uniref:DUF2393 family protein n=1 Tax=Sulfurospirillum arcachonense TaxID=57666 RepID=UPI000469077E|nr:DUF2393 family protein [Sulfurospirillum arcachonense]
MAYFTILHIITLLILLVLFIIACIVALKQTNKKILFSMLFANFLVITMLSVFSMFVLDKYTKIAKLENMTQKRILMTESLTISGKVRNIGNFDIGKCSLEVKLVNNAITSNEVSGSHIFSPISGLEFLFGKNKETRPSTILNEFVIAKNFKKGELKNFSITIKYPPYFQKPFMNYKLYCH